LLVANLEIFTIQLWQVGIRDVFADGSFAEDKDHPNDIDGYFVCALQPLITGELARVSGVNYSSRSTTIILPYRRQLPALQSCPLGLDWCWPEQRVRLCRDAT
jgi:hypothetical protein